MSGMLALGLLLAVPLVFLIGSDDDPEQEPDPEGTDGNDIILNGESTQGLVYELGDGNDELVAGSGDDTITNGAGAALISPGAGDDLINGSEGPMTVRDSPGDDTITGGQGNDWITDRTGANVIDGGAGADRIVAGDNSTVTGGDGVDSFSIQLNLSAPTPLVITDFTSEDMLQRMMGVEVFGDETGEISYEVRADGEGANILFEGRVVAEIMGASVADLQDLEVTYLLETAGSLTATGDAAQSFVTSTSANTVDAGAGNDNILSRGNDDGTGDVLLGAEGDDTLSAWGITERGQPSSSGGGFYFITEQSTLNGGAGDDVIRSRDSNVLTGGEGADEFELGFTDDTLINLPPASEITDFEQGVDQIEIQTTRIITSDSLSVVPWADGLGADILSGDHVLVRVTGGQGLTLADLDVT